MPFNPQRRWFQFSLRALMGTSFLTALLLGWWFRPFVIETHRADGSLRRQFNVCRDWRGRVVSHGKQTWVFSDGARVEKFSYGLPLEKDEFESLILPDHRRDVMFDDLIELITTTIVPDSGGDLYDTPVDASGEVPVTPGGTAN